MKRETKYTETERSEMKRNEIYQSETKRKETKWNATKFTETKRIEKKKSQAVLTDNHMNIDKKNHPQLLRQEQPCIWPMVIQIGLGTGMYVSTYSVLLRFGIFVSLNCIPFQFLCTFHFVSFRSVSVNFVTFHFVSFCFGKFPSKLKPREFRTSVFFS
jgi:hypothetical protein